VWFVELLAHQFSELLDGHIKLVQVEGVSGFGLHDNLTRKRKPNEKRGALGKPKRILHSSTLGEEPNPPHVTRLHEPPRPNDSLDFPILRISSSV
jgi:hypothetical protein